MEPFCLLMERTFSEFHPIYDMLQYHCRATLETNKLYDMKFHGKKSTTQIKMPRFLLETEKLLLLFHSTGPTGPLYNLLSVDYSTSIEIINKNLKELTMDNIDLVADMKVGNYGHTEDQRRPRSCVSPFRPMGE